MKTGTRLALVCRVILLLAVVGAVLPFSSSAAEESKQSVRMVRGEIVAVNVKDSPHVIVIKALTAKKQALLVGATVDSGATITRGAQRVGLDSLKVGESVALTYVKNTDGLVARSIHAK